AGRQAREGQHASGAALAHHDDASSQTQEVMPVLLLNLFRDGVFRWHAIQGNCSSRGADKSIFRGRAKQPAPPPRGGGRLPASREPTGSGSAPPTYPPPGTRGEGPRAERHRDPPRP